MGNIRENKDVVLTEEQRKQIESIVNTRQKEVDKIVNEKEKKKQTTGIRCFFGKGANPQQKVVDEIVRKEREKEEDER